MTTPDSEWIYCEYRYPRLSGKYLVAVRLAEKNANYILINEYDEKQKAFSFDLTMKERSLPDRVYAWQYIEPAPIYPDALRSKENQPKQTGK